MSRLRIYRVFVAFVPLLLCAAGLLLGSSRAAHAKPVEYVKVCDAFGTGFYYIPGTDTCLKINGYVRNDIVPPVQTGEGKICNNNYFTSRDAACSRNPAGPVNYVKQCDLYGAGFYYIPGTDTCLRMNRSWVRQAAPQTSTGLLPWFGKGPVVSGVVPNWSGLYLGAALGAAWSYANWTTTNLVTLNIQDPLVDAIKEMEAEDFAWTVYMGYTWWGAEHWLASLAAEFAYYDALMDPGIPGTGSIPGDRSADSVTVRANWSISLLARLGYLVTPTTQIYGVGGVSWLDMDATINCTGPGVCGTNGITPFSQTNSTTKAGLTIGGGIETMLWGSWRGKVEYRYSDYGTFSTNFGDPAGLALAADIDAHTHTLMFGLTYGFGGPPPPAI